MSERKDSKKRDQKDDREQDCETWKSLNPVPGTHSLNGNYNSYPWD